MSQDHRILRISVVVAVAVGITSVVAPELVLTYGALLLVAGAAALVYLPLVAVWLVVRAVRGARAERAYRRQYGVASGSRSRWWG